MIAFVQGLLAEKQPTRVVVDVNGVGYELSIPLSSYDRLPKTGEPCRLLTHFHVREDAHLLYGFVTEDERRLFELLISISGIGPRIALSALSGMSVRELKAAIGQGDVKRLSSISGIGRKIAERMIVELRDKISAGEMLEAVAGTQPKTEDDMRLRDAVLALIALGYTQEAARKMVVSAFQGGAAGAQTVEGLVKKALSTG